MATDLPQARTGSRFQLPFMPLIPTHVLSSAAIRRSNSKTDDAASKPPRALLRQRPDQGGDEAPPSILLEDILAPLHEAARDSASFIASRQPLKIRDAHLEVSKFLLLGQRGGGKPIRLGLFAGFEAGNLETVRVLAHLLLLL